MGLVNFAHSLDLYVFLPVLRSSLAFFSNVVPTPPTTMMTSRRSFVGCGGAIIAEESRARRHPKYNIQIKKVGKIN